MFCGNCGFKIEGSGKFCPQCGATINADEEVQNQNENIPQNSEEKADTPAQENVVVPPVQEVAKEAEPTPQAEQAAPQVQAQPQAEPQSQQANYAQPGMQQPYGQMNYAQPGMQQPYGQMNYAQPGMQQPYGQMNYAQPGYPQPGFVQPPKKPKKFKKGIFAAVSAVVIVAVALVGFNWSVVSNFFNKTFSSKEDYFRDVNKNAVSGFVEDISSFVGNMGTAFDKESKEDITTSSKGVLSVDIGDKGQELLNQLTKTDFSWLKGADIGIESHTYGDDVSFTLDVSLNDKKIATFEAVVENIMSEPVVYYRIPELSDEWLYMSVSGLMTGNDSINSNRAETVRPIATSQVTSNPYEIIEKIAGALPNEEVTEKLLTRYIGIVLDSIEDVESEKDEIEVNGVTQKCTKYTAKIDGDVLVNALTAVLKEAKKDSDIEDIIKNVAKIDELNLDADEVYDAFVSGIDEILDSIDESDVPEFEIEYSCYVDNKGDIIGLEVEFEGGSVSYLSPENGKTFAEEIKINANGMTVLKIDGEGTKSGKKRTGDFVISMSGVDFAEIKVTDYEATDDVLKGKIEFKPSSGIMATITQGMGISGAPSELMDLLSSLSLEMEFDIAKEKGSYGISLLSGSKMIVALECSAEPIENEDISAPSNAIDITNQSALQSWASKIDIQKFMSSLEDAGVPSSLINGIM